jgi:hypothetical protein
VNARANVSEPIVSRLRAICLEFPDAYEEQAWVGSRWMIRKKNFAHVLRIDAGWPPAYARAAKTEGPVTVLTFRSSARLQAPRFSKPPFFKPVWWPDIAGMTIDASTDWDEVSELLGGSYRLLAPKKLAARVE